MKKYLVGLIAVFMALGMSAFTAKPKPASFTNKFFKYLDYPNDANKNNPNRYELSTMDDCITTAHRCGVIAPSNGGTPERPVLTDPSVIIKNKD
jgi:hypothetical protein